MHNGYPANQKCQPQEGCGQLASAELVKKLLAMIVMLMLQRALSPSSRVAVARPGHKNITLMAWHLMLPEHAFCKSQS